MLAALVAVAAAFLYAIASVLQQWEAERQPAAAALRLNLMTRLMRRPRWLLGVGADAGGYVLQWVALSLGSLVVVQPLLVVGLLFALPINARFASYRLGAWDWSGALLTTVGLAMFLVVSQPTAGRQGTATLTWIAMLCAAGALAASLVAVGLRSGARWRAMSYGTAGGVLFGACAALTKTCAHLLSLGVLALVRSWLFYALLVLGAAGMVLAQSAFQAGPLDVSLPTLSATDPVVSVVIGVMAFGESIRDEPLATTFEALGLAVMVAGIFMLAHSRGVGAAEDQSLVTLPSQHQNAL